MVIELTSHALALLLQRASELGAKQALAQTGVIRPYLSKAEAYRLFGFSLVESWIAAGLITPRKDGDHSAVWRIDRLELDALRMAADLIVYL